MSMPSIYLDHHSTTPVLPEVGEAMRPWLGQRFGNPASAHSFGRQARNALENARERIAAWLGADPEEIVLTSGATEANNLALFGLIEPPARVLASPIEHPCVLEPLQQLEKKGCQIEYLPVNSHGIAQVVDISPEARHIVLMATNHETGAIQPIPPAGHYHWHCDAAQAVGKRQIHFHQLKATTLTVSGHKFGAPPGIGALLIKKGVPLRPLFFGGHQQQGRRPGTEPVALAVGLAKALEIACQRMAESASHVFQLRRHLIIRLEEVGPIVVNGADIDELQSPYVLNVSFPGLRADAILMAFDMAGVASSTGSACSSGSLLPSPVLKAMNLPGEVITSAMRLSFAASTTEDEIDQAANRINAAVRRIRHSQ